MNFDKGKIIQVRGDASFRKFYRKKFNNKRSIIIYSKKEKNKNLLNYEAINKLLNKNKISAPSLILENFRKNFIEVEDVGKKSVLDILNKKNSSKIIIYNKILKILIKLQKIKSKKVKNFQNKFYKIPKYSKKLIFNEANLFLDWYVPQVINKNKISIIKKDLKKIIASLTKKIQLPNNTFVHRDFHVSNLMIDKKKFSVIDSQDAVYGNIAYDLVSLIDDVRIKTSKNLKKTIYKNYLYLNKKKINNKKFKNDFDILSVLRNLKVIGIFSRLAKRDNKKKYLKLIPYAWKLIEYRVDNNNLFADLKKKLKDNFSNKIRIKK